jgi:hypothetical protein
MKTILFTLLALLSFQFSNAQLSANNNDKLNLIKKETAIKVFPKMPSNLVYIESSQTVDYFTLCNKKGETIFKTTPVNNKVKLPVELKNGFYLYEAYINGVKVKKGIIKKV